MSNPVWPPTLPQRFQYTNFTETAPASAIRTQMDTGPAKARQRFTAAPRPVKGQIRITFTQRQTLDDFFVTTLAGGTLQFDWTHPISGAAATFRFKSEPQYQSDRRSLIMAQLDLEIMP